MTYLANLDMLNAEFDYRTEQLRSGIGRQRLRRGAGRRVAATGRRRATTDRSAA